MTQTIWQQVMGALAVGILALIGVAFKKAQDILAAYLDRLATLAENKAAAATLTAAVTTAVKAVAQTTKGTDIGNAGKKVAALALLDRQGLLGDKVKVDTLVEAAVHDLPKAMVEVAGPCPTAPAPVPGVGADAQPLP
jgi:uncharacterized lipoprotein NlpE involved in copper resistance